MLPTSNINTVSHLARGRENCRGNKIDKPLVDFSGPTIAAYRKLAKHHEMLDVLIVVEVATCLGVAQQTVSDWFTTNTSAGISCKIDAKVKLNTAAGTAESIQEVSKKYPEPMTLRSDTSRGILWIQIVLDVLAKVSSRD